MKNYKKLSLLFLCMSCWLFSSIELQAQNFSSQEHKLTPIKHDGGIFLGGSTYGNKIIISDHVPNGGGTSALCNCNTNKELQFANINTPSIKFINWNEFNAQAGSAYAIEINGKMQDLWGTTSKSRTAFIYDPNVVEYSQCNSYQGKAVSNSLVFNKKNHPKYRISFHQEGIVVTFQSGVIYSLTIYYLPNCGSSIDHKMKENTSFSFTASPNPFQTQLRISYQIEKNTTGSLYLYNAMGQAVATLFENRMLLVGEHQQPFELQLAKGVYYAVLRTPKEQKMIKLIRQ